MTLHQQLRSQFSSDPTFTFIDSETFVVPTIDTNFAVSLNLYVISDSDTLGQDFYDRVADLVAERIKQCGNRVPVVTGKISRPHADAL